MLRAELFNQASEFLNISHKELMTLIVSFFGFRNQEDIVEQNLKRLYREKQIPDYCVRHCEQILGASPQRVE